MARPIYMTDLTAAFIDDRCGRQYWYRELEGGRGIMRREDVIPDQILSATYSDLHTLQILDEDDLTAPALAIVVGDLVEGLSAADRANEALMRLFYRRLGWIAAWGLYFEGIVRRCYDTIPLPETIMFERDPLKIKITPGRLLRGKGGKQVTYRTFQPTPIVTALWKGTLPYQLRPYIEAMAVQDETGIGIDQIQVVSLATGRPYEGGLTHPYVTAYHKEGTQEWNHNFLLAKGPEWKTRPVWEYGAGVVAWVLKCGLDVANAQFSYSNSFSPLAKVVDAWVARRLHRERTILGMAGDAHGNHHLRNQHFPMNTTACAPLFEEKCPYTTLCWCHGTVLNPLASDKFVARRPVMAEEVENVAQVTQP